MRLSTSSLVFVFCVAAGAALSACSGETTENPGGGGGSGGDGGAGTTSSSTSSSSTSTTSTSAASTSASTTSSGAGGDGGSAGNGTMCDQACDKAEECTEPVCNILTFDCADPAAECSAQCVLDASCEQIQSLSSNAVDPELAGCLSDCQGTEGGGSGLECLSCTARNGCMANCTQDIACLLWLACAQGCMENDPQPECFSRCNAEHSGANELAGAVYDCACTDCSESCGAVVDPCNQPGM